MGYHAANIAGALDRENREKLAEIVTMGLVDERDDWHYDVPPVRDPSIRVRLRPRDDGARLQIILQPAASTRVEGTALYLQAVDAGQVGEAVVDLRGRAPSAQIPRASDAAGDAAESEHRRNGRVRRS